MIKQVLNSSLVHAEESERGFSLIEMMIAITVLSVGLVAIVGMSVSVSRANSTSNILSILATTVQDQADSLRLARWTTTVQDSRLTLGGDTNYDSSDNNHRTVITGTPAGNVKVSWKVVAGPGTKGDVRTITINAVQEHPPARLAKGITVTMIIYQS